MAGKWGEGEAVGVWGVVGSFVDATGVREFVYVCVFLNEFLILFLKCHHIVRVYCL
jgi:hypothetical protein